MTKEMMAYYDATNTVLLFQKRTVAELTDGEMLNVNGGTTPVCAAAAASSGYCGAAALGFTFTVGAFSLGFVVGFLDGVLVE
jgi:lactobin A/cerein 7B family class IIb bacteriocin